MTREECINKLGPLFQDAQIVEAILTLIGLDLDAERSRLSYASGDLFSRAAELIEASGGVKALESLTNKFANLTNDFLMSLNDQQQD